MQIEEAKKEFKIIIDTVRGIFKLDVQEDDEDIYEIDGRQFFAIETLLNELEEQTEANKELNKVLIHFKAVINEMAKMINSHDIDEDVCGQMGKNKHCNDYVMFEENCIECIKEYFYKKVSDNK